MISCVVEAKKEIEIICEEVLVSFHPHSDLLFIPFLCYFNLQKFIFQQIPKSKILNLKNFSVLVVLYKFGFVIHKKTKEALNHENCSLIQEILK